MWTYSLTVRVICSVPRWDCVIQRLLSGNNTTWNDTTDQPEANISESGVIIWDNTHLDVLYPQLKIPEEWDPWSEHMHTLTLQLMMFWPDLNNELLDLLCEHLSFLLVLPRWTRRLEIRAQSQMGMKQSIHSKLREYLNIKSKNRF